MKIADLFADITIEGGKQAAGVLGTVGKGLGGIGSMSLAAKAQIAAVLYGLERMMSASAQNGMALEQFGNITGLSTDRLQRWQYAARQSGVSADEFTGSLKSVQNSMTNMLLGKGAPEGMGLLARTVGFDPNKVRDTFYVMEKLKEFAKISPPDVGNSVLKSFGISEGTIGFLRTTAVDLDKIKPSNLYSGGEISQLARVNAEWSNLGDKMSKAFGHITAAHGLSLVTDIEAAADAVIKLVNAFVLLAEKIHLFKGVGVIFEGWQKLFEGISGAVESVTPGKAGTTANAASPGVGKFLTDNKNMLLEMISGPTTPSITPRMQMPATPPPSSNMTVNNNITHIGDASDTKAVGDTHKKAARDAYRTSGAQAQVN